VDTVTDVGLSYELILELLKASVACSSTPKPTTPTPKPIAPGGACGNAQVGPQSCVDGEYCQPWNPWYYSCRQVNAKCGKQEVGIDYYGNDLMRVSVLLPEECCDQCHALPDCTSYTFVNYNADNKAWCYLKKGVSDKRHVEGAVSAVINRPRCSTRSYGPCGDN
jgi:glucan 1,3-beta-glucosidase